MKVKINLIDENYILNINYTVSIYVDEVWNWIATTDGFSKWFSELHIEEVNGVEKLVFKMDDFIEEMDILTKVDKREISYKWDTAVVKFSLEELDKETKITFQEIIPKNFENPYSNAKKDMVGWFIQNERLYSLMNGKQVRDIKELQEKWEKYMEMEVE